MFALLNNYTVLSLAQNVAMLRVPGATGPQDPRVADASAALAAPDPRARAERLLAAGIGAVVVDGEAPHADDVPLIAGTPLGEHGGLSVLVLDGEPAAHRPGPVSVLATGLAWAAYISVLVIGLAGNAVRRRRRC